MLRDRKKLKTGKDRQTLLTVTQPVTLMKFLCDRMPHKSRSAIKSLLAHHQISVDDKVTTRFDHPLEVGQHVMVNWSKVQQGSPHKGLKIVFEDSYIIVIEKPPGLLSIAAAREKERTAYRVLSDQAKKLDPKRRIFVVHRLDREASGLMMFAKSREIQELLQEKWQQNVLDRTYVAVVEGPLQEEQGIITSWLKENKARVMYSSTRPDDGQKAVTRYRVLKKNNAYSLLEIELETGRKNQIRIHMKDLGHSIIGDKKYGSKQNPINRMGLHARVLAFRHPVTGKEMRFETPVPEPFSSLFSRSPG